MVSQDVLAELAAFNLTSIADLLGADAEVRLGEIIRDRQELVDHGLKALSLQYPGYAESIRDRQLERAAIRFESAEYTRRLREAVIGREVYADLRRALNERRSAIADRPPLNLGLELTGMIGRVPLFASLDSWVLAELGKRLRPVVALPGDKIIAQGGPPDSMYFIAAGEVQVILRSGPVTLKDGDFFGEGGLLERRPRNADVISVGYSHLLVLHRKEFNELLDQRPELRTKIEAVAARRATDLPDAAGQ
jgi:CPA1 family monovalent cation:H+ antiporter